MEIWKPIIHLTTDYAISNYGRVKSLERKLIDGRIWKERIIKPVLSQGYYSVTLRVNNLYVKERVHRLVGFTFLEGYQEKYVINHKDGNKLNNHISNLEWCTYKHNLKHAINTGLNNGIKKMHEANLKKTVQLNLDGTVIKIYESAKDAAKAVKCPIQNITRVCRKERNTARGYKWCYLKDYENRTSI